MTAKDHTPKRVLLRYLESTTIPEGAEGHESPSSEDEASPGDLVSSVLHMVGKAKEQLSPQKSVMSAQEPREDEQWTCRLWIRDIEYQIKSFSEDQSLYVLNPPLRIRTLLKLQQCQEVTQGQGTDRLEIRAREKFVVIPLSVFKDVRQGSDFVIHHEYAAAAEGARSGEAPKRILATHIEGFGTIEMLSDRAGTTFLKFLK